MSMTRCFNCDEFVDTDFDLEGIWAGVDYTCESCCENMSEEERAQVTAKMEAKWRGK